jgi:hypothetical protein
MARRLLPPSHEPDAFELAIYLTSVRLRTAHRTDEFGLDAGLSDAQHSGSVLDVLAFGHTPSLEGYPYVSSAGGPLATRKLRHHGERLLPSPRL